LEILDGADTKRQRRIVVGTTNFLETMETATIRAGRFSTVVDCGLPDRQAFEQVIRLCVKEEFLDDDIDFDAAFPAYSSYTYAFIANAVTAMMLNAIKRFGGDLSEFHVTTEDLIAAGVSQADHFALMAHEPTKPIPTMDAAYRQVLGGLAEEVAEQVADVVHVETDYDVVYEATQSATDNVIEGRLDRSTIEDGDGNESTLRTN